jgi:Zn-dependent peptidase ImmA (M78 family)
MYKGKLTITELENLLKFWQKQLLLDKWDLSIEIVEFARKDYPQNGDIRVEKDENRAVILISNKPIKDEEYIIVHELVHLILYDLDNYCENLVLKESTKKLVDYYNRYNENLENTVDHLARAYIDANNKKGNE